MTDNSADAHKEPQPHDPNVAFENRVAPVRDIDINAWSWAIERHGSQSTYIAAGPCPACHAPCEGWGVDGTQPIEKSIRGPEAETRASDTFDVMVTCQCGFPHGRDGGKSCGRRWTITGPSQQ